MRRSVIKRSCELCSATEQWRESIVSPPCLIHLHKQSKKKKFYKSLQGFTLNLRGKKMEVEQISSTLSRRPWENPSLGESSCHCMFFPLLGFFQQCIMAMSVLRSLSVASSDTAVTWSRSCATGQAWHAWVSRSNKELVFRGSFEAGSD